MTCCSVDGGVEGLVDMSECIGLLVACNQDGLGSSTFVSDFCSDRDGVCVFEGLSIADLVKVLDDFDGEGELIGDRDESGLFWCFL